MSLLAQFLFLLLPFLVAAEDKTLPVRELVHRLIPSHADQIGLFLDLKTPNGTVAKVCVTSSIDKYGIEIHGSDVNTLATGVLFYLNSVNASVSWEATGGGQPGGRIATSRCTTASSRGGNMQGDDVCSPLLL